MFTEIDYQFNEQWCSNNWVGIICWPRTKGDEIAEVNCPDYIEDFDSSKKLQRTCFANGSWATLPLTLILSECISPDSPIRETQLPKNIYKYDFYSIGLVLDKIVLIVGYSRSHGAYYLNYHPHACR